MPLFSLVDSVQTLTHLIARSRQLRGQDDLPPGTLEQVDRMTDEALEMVNSLVRTLVEAYARGNLDAMIRREEDDMRESS